MRLLLDENLPKKLKQDFTEFEINTAAEMGWAGKTNGELLKFMISEKFDALLTFDKNLQHQQNFKKYSLTVFVLSAINNTYK
jgi:predicted nuclease of predicted toxin-antitoxin system